MPILVFILITVRQALYRCSTDSYACRDRKMSLSDRLRKTFRKYGALSSAEATNIINQKTSTPVSQRTVLRYINDLIKEGVLKQNATGGREQTYSYCREKPSPISDFFLNKFWSELFSVRQVLHDNRYDPAGNRVLEAWDQLFTLIKMLPENIRVELKVSDLEKERIVKIQKKLTETHANNKKVRKFLRKSDQFVIEVETAEFVADTIEKVATVLHRELQKEIEKEGVKP